jgi:hypothetical protein
MKGNKAKGTWDFQLWALFGPHASSNVRFAPDAEIQSRSAVDPM